MEEPEPIVGDVTEILVRVLDDPELRVGREEEEHLHRENIDAINRRFRGRVRKALDWREQRAEALKQEEERHQQRFRDLLEEARRRRTS